MKKKILASILTLALGAVAFIGCAPQKGAQTEDKTIVVGATQVPHAEILEEIRADIEAKGYKLDVKVFTDYILPNQQLAEKGLDANFFQHYLYLEDQMQKNANYKFEVVADVHMEPMGLYSKKYTSLNDIPEGATIAVPNDPSNEARALFILQAHGLITLDDPNNLQAKAIDVSPKSKVKITEIDAAQMAAILPDVDGAMINTNFALQANLRPGKDALLVEDKDSEAAQKVINILVAREDNASSEKIQVLKEAINSQKVKDFILEKYQGDVIPAF